VGVSVVVGGGNEREGTSVGVSDVGVVDVEVERVVWCQTTLNHWTRIRVTCHVLVRVKLDL
jgi:hypothetical protein